MAKVFVNCAEADQKACQQIFDALADAHLTTSHSVFGSGGKRALEREEPSCIVLLWSRAAARSKSVREDIGLAIEAWGNGRLVLATLDDSRLPVGLRGS